MIRNKCPHCLGSLKISSCNHAHLLYCKTCQWGVVSFDDDIESIIDMDEKRPALVNEQHTFSERQLVS